MHIERRTRELKDLATPENPLQEAYSRIYAMLAKLREGFHRSGRVDDSNAKLDEVSKLFATYLAFKRRDIDKFPAPNAKNLVSELQDAFGRTVRLDRYCTAVGSSIFGAQPLLSLRSGDEQIAGDLVRLVRESVDLAFALRKQDRPFDVLNEAFGHFIRDNFRGNIEDAQFMTPPEVVNFMADMVLQDIQREDPQVLNSNKHWTVVDPSCGVGSFLTVIYDRARRTDWLEPSRLRLFAQDKVERMVRLSTINMELFDTEVHRITQGDTLAVGSPLDKLNGTVDIILTNPPFGARFRTDFVRKKCRNNTPFFSSLKYSPIAVDSELLFIDRNLKLLTPGGRLLIIVPDSVVSAKGTAALLRNHVAKIATVRAIVELPSVAFAQAGTRTKTSILYLQKCRDNIERSCFLAISKGLGFRVSSRKGVQVKIPDGEDELLTVAKVYTKRPKSRRARKVSVLSTDPSCSLVPESDVLRGSWTPNHYSARRLKAIQSIESNKQFRPINLSELVDLCSDKRSTETWRKGYSFISVLHILREGFIDISGVLNYAPKSPGIKVFPGELLMSRINPRIPRVCVVPDLGVPTLCSPEFEVMNPKFIDVYKLAFLLQTVAVQNQVRSLTSGTSASHNRIRTGDLARVVMPWPRPRTRNARLLNGLAAEYRTALEALVNSSIVLATIRKREAELFNSSAEET